MELELELGLALPNHSPMISRGLDLNSYSDRLETENRKPKRDRCLGDETTTTLTSLLLWPEERCPRKWRKIHVDDDDDDECQKILEGWPPMKSPPRRCVKVKMEGVAIGRKIDLRHYHSYQALTNTFIHMFAKYTKIETKMEEYTLSYQGKEGDWKLVGDDHVQWEMFIESVQRVQIIKNNSNLGFRLLSRKS